MRKFIYRLGGAQPNVINHCNEDTQTQYKNLGWAVIICTGVSAISGADIAHQYTTSVAITVAGSLLFALLTFSFDYFINNSSSNKVAPKLLRVPVALANVLVGTAALMVMLNQTKIDSKLLLDNTKKITNCDSTYQADKAIRYNSYSEKKQAVETYHKNVCYPEAQLGYAGKSFDKKHKYCLTQDSILAIEKALLDTSEAAFFQTYQTEKAGLKAVNTSSFPEKCAELPGIFKENWFTLLIAICVFIVSFYIECQSLIMKFSINKNDDYHTTLTLYNNLHKTNVEDRVKKMTDHLNKLNGLKAEQTNTEEITKWATDKLNSTLNKAPIHYKLNEYKRILQENGMQELSSEIANIQNTITDTSDMEKAMNHLINNINRN